MKGFKRIIYVWLAVILCLTVSMPPVHAAELIDTDRVSSLHLQYSHSGMYIEDLEISVHKVADVDDEGNFILCDDFREYNVELSGVRYQQQWSNIAATLAAYAEADGKEADFTGTTDNSGMARFTGLKPGLYLTMAASCERDGKVILFESFLTAIPDQDSSGRYNYDVIAFPKSESYTPEPGEVEYKVVKHWKDSDYEDWRPAEIEVEILKDGEQVSYQILNSDNNWSYSWTAPDDGSQWTAVERNIPEGYTAEVVRNDKTIIITNVYEDDPSGDTETDEKPEGDDPKTGDITSVWLYTVIMCFSGILLMLVALWNRRRE